jgi:Multisubunit Na+/H+ antiporter, MnhE subunit
MREPSRVLVPVGTSRTMRRTVGHALEAVLAADGPAPAIHLVAVARWRGDAPPADRASTERSLELAATWVEEGLAGAGEEALTVETAIVGTDRYLFSPDDIAAVLGSYHDAQHLQQIIIDPEYRPAGSAPLLASLEAALETAGYAIAEAPVERPVARTPLQRGATLAGRLGVAVVTFLFYLALAGSTAAFEVATATVTAALAGWLFGPVTLATPVPLRLAVARSVRLLVFIPYLIIQILIANFQIARIILDPRLPIAPHLDRLEAAVYGGLPVTTLANAITLTPGTLTVDADQEGLVIHSLTGDSRDDLAAGGLERAVRFVFYGREGARIDPPSGREAIETTEVPER